MHILINTSSGQPKTRRGPSAIARGRNSTAGRLVVSCEEPKRIGRDKECACTGLHLDDQPEHASSTLDALGIALLNRGCLAEGAKLIEQALRIRRKFFGDDHPLTAESLNSYGRVLREKGLLADAQKTLETALRINRKAFGEDGYPVAVSLVESGVIYLNRGRYAEAESAAIEGLGILNQRGLDDTDPNTTRLMDVRGRAEAARDDLKAAEATFKEILRLDREQGANLPKSASHIANFASVKESQGLFKQAEAGYLKAIDVYANKLKRRCHPNLIDAYANLGSLYLSRNAKSNDLRNAGRYLKEALRLSLKVRGPGHLLVANDHSNLGRLSYQLKDRRGALKHFFAALQIYEKNLKRGFIDSTYIFTAEVLTWLGRLLVEGAKASEAAKAEPLLERAVTIWAAHPASGELGAAAANGCLGRALFLQDKDPDRARALLLDSYSVLSKELGNEHVLVKLIRQWLDELSACAQAA